MTEPCVKAKRVIRIADVVNNGDKRLLKESLQEEKKLIQVHRLIESFNHKNNIRISPKDSYATNCEQSV